MKLLSKAPFYIFMFILSTQISFSQEVRAGKPGTPGSWRIIGTTVANYTADHDAIIITGPFDNFRKIKFKVTDAPLHLMRLQITYDNGQIQNVETRHNIRQGGESRAIDLPGNVRRIRRIDFWYDTASLFRGKAKVTVFGMK